MPQLQQLGRIDPQVMAGVLQAQPQLINRVHQHAASQQLLQVQADALCSNFQLIHSSVKYALPVE